MEGQTNPKGSIMEFTLNELILIQNGLAHLEDDYGTEDAAPIRERIEAEIERRRVEEK